jgi:cytosine/adenosine deaminase-related metal-dependent hydrolase
VGVLLAGGQVLSLERGTLERADVLLDDDRIAAVGAPGEAGAEIRLDVGEMIVLPGLINAHTHGHNNLARGLAGRWTLEGLLNYGFALQSNRTPEDHYLSAAIGAIEMLRSGCTAAYDLYMALPVADETVLEAVVQAYVDVGIRVTLAPSAADIPFHQALPGLADLLPDDLRTTVAGLRAQPAAHLLAITESAIRRWHGTAGGRIEIGVSPAIPTQCSDDFLAGCARVAREHGVSLHTHLAESRLQPVASHARWGCTIVERLAEVEAIGPGFVGAHGIWLTGEEMTTLAGASSTIAHNPASNLRLGSGVAPVRELLDAGVRVALGTDGSLSSDNQDMFEAMRFASLVSRVREHDPARWIDASEAWSLATAGGARALGKEAELGRLEPGAKADLVLLRADSTFLRPPNAPVNALALAETGAAVDTVLVDGRLVLQHGRVLGVNERAIHEQALAAAERLRHENRELWVLADALAPFVAEACASAVG